MLQECLQLKMELKDLRTFLTISGINYIFVFWSCQNTSLFYKIVDSVASSSIRHGVHKLPKSMVYLLVPGTNYKVIISLS